MSTPNQPPFASVPPVGAPQPMGVPQPSMPQPMAAPQPMGAPPVAPPPVMGQPAYSPGMPSANVPPKKKCKMWPLLLVGGLLLVAGIAAGVFFGIIRPQQIALAEAKETFDVSVAAYEQDRAALDEQITVATAVIDSTVATDYMIPDSYDQLVSELEKAKALEFTVPEKANKLADLEKQTAEIEAATQEAQDAQQVLEKAAGSLVLVKDVIGLAVDVMNATMKGQIENDVRFDGVEQIEDRTLLLTFTIMDLSVSQFPASQLPQVREATKKEVISMFTNSSDMKDLLDLNITFKIKYLDKNAKEIITLTITPADYQ
ncbi:MAG: hypothetical protein FWG15_02135 [Propionibacteriaceae bacterium]|nr:hypothetical protein [Propionibacteriaceae bacterium]